MTAPRRSLPPDGVIRADRLRLSVTDALWPLAIENAAAITDHFARRKAGNPSFYDGQVFVLRDVWLEGAGIAGTLSLERFSSFLYWRDGMARDGATLDGFGSALVRSSEGHVLAVTAAQSTLNAGQVFLPGGFIDQRDRRGDRSIDIDASITRELLEETGLDAAALQRVPGYLVARSGRH
ncbi:MAG: NUDIX domain-containing protein [Hyphomicrobiaceae bacterium]